MNMKQLMPDGSTDTLTGIDIQISPEDATTIATAMAERVRTADIANNLTTADAGKVLSALQGKLLNDALAGKQPTITRGNAAETRTALGMMRRLWGTGSWSGTSAIIVPGITDYTLFTAKVGATLLFCSRVGAYFRGSTSFALNGNMYTYFLMALVDAETNQVTLQHCRALIHYGEGNHGGYADQTITEIHGIC